MANTQQPQPWEEVRINGVLHVWVPDYLGGPLTLLKWHSYTKEELLEMLVDDD